MAKFNPAMLVPAALSQEFTKSSGARTAQQVALDNIERTKKQFEAGDKAEGKTNFKVVGEKVSFSIRVSNTALVLGTYEHNGATAEVRQMVVPRPNFLEALTYFADKIKAGELDAQLALLSEKKEARTSKLRATRAQRKQAAAV